MTGRSDYNPFVDSRRDEPPEGYSHFEAELEEEGRQEAELADAIEAEREIERRSRLEATLEEAGRPAALAREEAAAGLAAFFDSLLLPRQRSAEPRPLTDLPDCVPPITYLFPTCCGTVEEGVLIRGDLLLQEEVRLFLLETLGIKSNGWQVRQIRFFDAEILAQARQATQQQRLQLIQGKLAELDEFRANLEQLAQALQGEPPVEPARTRVIDLNHPQDPG